MKEISTEIEINAPAEKVWQVLTDFAHFPDWNPFIREIIGSVVEGSRLEIHISTSSGKNRTYKPTLTKIEPNHELRWYGKGLLPGLLNGERIFTIEQLAQNHVRMIHREIFTGLGTLFTGDRMDKDIHHSFEEMNNALKKKLNISVSSATIFLVPCYSTRSNHIRLHGDQYSRAVRSLFDLLLIIL